MRIVVFADSLSLVGLCPRDIAKHIPCLEASVVELVAQTLVAKYVVGVAHLIYTLLSGGVLHGLVVPSVEVGVVVVVELIATIEQRRGHIARVADCVGYADGARYCLTSAPSRCPVGIASEQIWHEAELI